MVTKHKNIDHITGVVKAAQTAGHAVQIFLTDEAVRFTQDPQMLDLLALPEVRISCCDHNRKQKGIQEKAKGIFYGSQFDNALMMHKSTRVLVF